MNKKRYYYLLAPAVLLMAGVAMSGCSDRDEAAPQVTAKAGEPILFGIADTQSRTHYTEDKYQIDWDVYDKIGIYSDKAKPGSALEGKRFAYYMINQVFPDTDQEHDYHGAIVPVANRDVVEITEGEEAPSLEGEEAGTYGLMWGDEDTFSEEYTFYGAYPACRITKSPADDPDYFTMEYHTNQTVTVESVSNGVYTTKPDMLNAYMMAEKTILPRKDHILLDFDPIMTTLDIHITAGGYELGTGIINPVTITGVSVMMPGALTNKALRYNVAAGTTGEPHGGDGSSTRLSDVSTSQKESVFVGIDNYGKRYVDLFEGESISLLAFLPPMDMKTGVKIKVHAVGALNFEVTVDKEMIRQGRIDIQLPDVKPSSEMTPEQAALQTNNWISQLDGNIHLSQMSIPGYDCEKEETPQKIETLLKMGVRVFDIDNIINHGGEGFWGDSYRNLPNNLVEVFNSFILNNEGEFIILLYEDDNDKYLKGINLGSFKNDINAANWKTMSISELKGKIVAFEWRTTLLGSGYVASQTDGIWNTDPYTFNRFGIVDKEQIEEQIGEIYPNTDWNMVYMNWDENATEGDKIDVTKTIYEKVASDNKQNRDGGCTGIVLVPNAGVTYNQDLEQYTYSDLLIQAIIDCNYKLILDRNLNQP